MPPCATCFPVLRVLALGLLSALVGADQQPGPGSVLVSIRWGLVCSASRAVGRHRGRLWQSVPSKVRPSALSARADKGCSGLAFAGATSR
jgi:hypothetical protein